MLFIPLLKKAISINGEVNRPAIFEIKNEKTIQDVIDLAGGLLPNANKKRISVERINAEQQRIFQTLDISIPEIKNSSIFLITYIYVGLYFVVF